MIMTSFYIILFLIIVCSSGLNCYEPGFWDNPNNGFYPNHASGFWNTTRQPFKRSPTDDTEKNFEKIIRCNYKVADSLLTCYNKNLTKDVVECSAGLNLSSLERFNFEMFGIEQVSISNNPDFKFKYNLYPFKLNKKTKDRIFYNHQMTINYKNVVLSLFSSDKLEYSGIKVNNMTCFKNLDDLFVRSSQKNKVDLNISAVNSVTKIVFIGELHVINQPKIVVQHGSIIEETNHTQNN